jgi:hypothetical protein
MRDVKSLYWECQDTDEMRELGLRALEMALTCHSTFYIDQRHSQHILQDSTEFGTAIESSISIHDHCPSDTSSLPEALKMLLVRFQRRSHFLEGLQRRMLLTAAEGVDFAVRQVWQGYRPGPAWSPCPQPNERWIATETPCGIGATSRRVHYNLLNGSLLVDGCPLSRLPRSYELERSYVSLFGQVSRIH